VVEEDDFAFHPRRAERLERVERLDDDEFGLDAVLGRAR
jgi:hypothetical protein